MYEINLRFMISLIIIIYCAALSLKPDDPLTLRRRADALGKLGRQTEAIEDYIRAIDIQTRPHRVVGAL